MKCDQTTAEADTKIHEDQLRTVLVTALTGAFGRTIAENGAIEPADIDEGHLGATADGKCLSLIQTHNHAYLMPIVTWGTKIQNELSEGRRRWWWPFEEFIRMVTPAAFICGRGAVSVPNVVRD